MPYANETDRYKIPWWETAEISSGDSNEDAALNTEWPLELINKVVAGEACDCTLGSGFQVSAGAGLSIDVAAGSGQIGGLVIYAGDVTNKASLPDDTATIYVYLKLTATTKRDRSFTVEVSLSGPPLADAIYIATCTTAAGAVTVVNNSPASRTPRLPGAISGIPGLRVVAPAGAQYTDPKTAIEACIAGDLVYICAGTYTLTEVITLPADNITILGASRNAVILNNTTDSTQTIIELNGKDGIRLQSFTIQSAAGNAGTGIYGDYCDDLTISNVRITSTALTQCLSIRHGARCFISRIVLSTGGTYGILFYAMTDSAITHSHLASSCAAAATLIYLLPGVDRVTVAYNFLYSTGAAVTRAIYAYDCDDLIIERNILRFDSPGAGLFIYLRAVGESGVRHEIVGNRVISSGNNGAGICLQTTDPYTLDECIVAGNGVFAASIGVQVADARVTDTLVHGNKVATCTTGVSDTGTNTNALDQD